jgi:hypothetical protein
MTDYGITAEGYSRKPLTTILAEVEAFLITEFGTGLIQTSQSPMGQINGVFAEGASKFWELGEDIYQSLDPDQAEGSGWTSLAAFGDFAGEPMRVMRASAKPSQTPANRALTSKTSIAPSPLLMG